MYLEGECAENNPEKAVHWFEKAAEQGLQGSMTTLAMMYREGNGVEADEAKAKEWFRKAGFDEM
jgi:TPR repeat protein